MNDAKHTILCVDDEENILHSLKRLLRKEGYNLLTASSGKDAFEILKKNEIHLVISDQRMPEMSGTEFLAQVKKQYPDILRVILTGYTDVDSITESINKGNIYKFFLKPWNDQTLKLEIRQALEQYDLIRANQKLDKTVVEQTEKIKCFNERFDDIVEVCTQEFNLQNKALELARALMENLPMVIIGVNTNAEIVLANKEARDAIDLQGIAENARLDNFFPQKLHKAVDKVIKSGQVVYIEGRMQKGVSYKAELLPLPERFRDKGIVMTLHIT